MLYFVTRENMLVLHIPQRHPAETGSPVAACRLELRRKTDFGQALAFSLVEQGIDAR